MEISNRPFDVTIVGGGLAGLSLAILLSRSGHKVVLFEKEKYPFHKVCGEYISGECWNFIKGLGFNLSNLELPIIKKLIVSSPGGNFLKSDLDLGGFGISRFFLDNELKEIALKNGAVIHDQTKVNDVVFDGRKFIVKFNGGEIASSIAAGCFGKRSNLDVKWKRNFTKKKPGKLNNYVGVKYHIRNNFPDDTIALHNFRDGYCGISKVEDDQCCLCYLTTARNLHESNNSVREMEQRFLFKNPFIRKIFSESEFLFDEPVAIAQISFDRKSQVRNHIIMLGDAAGMIAPLCGNGMSMAFQSAKIASENIHLFLNKHMSREDMENRYTQQWQALFAKRLARGRLIQKLFGKKSATDIFIRIVKSFPSIGRAIIKQTHGKQF